MNEKYLFQTNFGKNSKILDNPKKTNQKSCRTIDMLFVK